MKTILIVDDDIAIQQLFSDLITSETEHRCIVAEDGEAALDIVIENNPDLIFLDMNMPRINGLAFLNDLKHIPEAKKTPVIAISGEMMDENFKAEVLKLGAVEYFCKPIEIELLLNTMRKYMK